MQALQFVCCILSFGFLTGIFLILMSIIESILICSSSDCIFPENPKAVFFTPSFAFLADKLLFLRILSK